MTFTLFSIGIISCASVLFIKIIVGKIKFVANSIDILVLFLCTFYSIKGLLSIDYKSSCFFTLHGIIIPAIVYFCTKTLLTNKQTTTKFCYFYTFGTVILSIYMAMNIMLYGRLNSVGGITSISGATYLFLGLCIAIYIIYNQNKLAKIVSIFLNAIGFISTLSRMYTLALFVMIFMKNIFRKTNIAAGYIILMLMTLIVTLVLTSKMIHLSVQVSREQITEMEHGADRLTNMDSIKYALAGRIEEYNRGMELFYKSPITGAGIQRGLANITQHNVHVAWLAYGGIVGYAIYFSIFLIFFLRITNKDKSDGIIFVGTATTFAVILNSLTNGIMHGAMPIVAFLAMGMTTAQKNQQKDMEGYNA